MASDHIKSSAQEIVRIAQRINRLGAENARLREALGRIRTMAQTALDRRASHHAMLPLIVAAANEGLGVEADDDVRFSTPGGDARPDTVQAENARLRGKLEEIAAKGCGIPGHSVAVGCGADAIARRALEADDGE